MTSVKLDIDPSKLYSRGDGINGSHKHNGPQGYTSYEYTKSYGGSFELELLSYESEKYLYFLPPKGKISKVTTYFKNTGNILLAVQITTEKDRNYYYVRKDARKDVDDKSEFDEFVENGKNRLSDQDIRTILQKVEASTKLDYKTLPKDIREKFWRKNDATVDINRYPADGIVKPDGKSYYYTSEVGRRVDLVETRYPDRDGVYRKLTHTPKDGELGTIKYDGGFQILKPEPIQKSNISVYYWIYDEIYYRPLILQFFHESSSVYYTTTNGFRWNETKDINDSNLREELNKQNCKRRGAHAINISEKSESYQCPSCKNYQLNILLDREKQYYIHGYQMTENKAPPSIFRFFEDTREQTGFPFVTGINNICRYATPKVILDASKTETTEATYNPRRNTLKFKVSKKDIDQSYAQYIHNKDDSGSSRLKDIEHKGVSLGVKSEDILTEVSIFYLDGDAQYDKPLLVELVASENKYTYYRKARFYANTWTKIANQETNRLEEDNLKTELEKLKKIHFPDPSSDVVTIVGASLGTVGTEITTVIGIWKRKAILSAITMLFSTAV
ncbi:hypothetical protein BEWA_036880 [Theileria equi strain WA]|uniref:Uncharacterized protein n=1 Tax=Theileria equi strain WA TaxID=1537102 RepID=L1LDY7_THEEQ|nr:hypothetical protein BEWA_036880 [Theileria equi strain WA]EKX73652.1 hypothetical protein BEWA_036880 [Theileria equi strain WA]|eukprot:XP_004833104.1 hypothetical protein BEWA_036880 [Theileria equi strain WA]